MPRSPEQSAAQIMRLNRFAELISQDLPIPIICERMGIGKGVAHALMMKLRNMYGER